MALILFDPVAFRNQYQALFCPNNIDNETLQAYFDNATAYISNRSGGCFCGGMTTAQQKLALYLMTAHLVSINNMIAKRQTPGILTSATVDKVTVTIQPPPAANQWQYWLQSTPYGAQLLAMLQRISAGGYYVGGRPELSAFPRAGFGRFCG